MKINFQRHFMLHESGSTQIFEKTLFSIKGDFYVLYSVCERNFTKCICTTRQENIFVIYCTEKTYFFSYRIQLRCVCRTYTKHLINIFHKYNRLDLAIRYDLISAKLYPYYLKAESHRICARLM